MITIPLMTIFAFIFGAIIGSFLNVVILRMNTGRGVSGRSQCFSCGTTLRAIELVPIFSFLRQGGRCVTCRRKISWQYPLVEIITGTVFALLASNPFALFGSVTAWLGYFFLFGALFSLLIVIAVYDLRHRIIPDAAVYVFILLALLAPMVTPQTAYYFGSLWADHIVAGIALSLPFALIWLFSQGRLMGLGDAKLALGMGLMLGLSSGVAAVMLAFWIGAVVGVLLLLLRRTNLTIKSEIPFAPFLAIGTVLAFLCHIDLSVLAILFTWS